MDWNGRNKKRSQLLSYHKMQFEEHSMIDVYANKMPGSRSGLWLCSCSFWGWWNFSFLELRTGFGALGKQDYSIYIRLSLHLNHKHYTCAWGNASCIQKTASIFSESNAPPVLVRLWKEMLRSQCAVGFLQRMSNVPFRIIQITAVRWWRGQAPTQHSQKLGMQPPRPCCLKHNLQQHLCSKFKQLRWCRISQNHH